MVRGPVTDSEAVWAESASGSLGYFGLLAVLIYSYLLWQRIVSQDSEGSYRRAAAREARRPAVLGSQLGIELKTLWSTCAAPTCRLCGNYND